MYHIVCTVYSLYEFVDEKVENKLKSNKLMVYLPYCAVVNLWVELVY